MVKNGLGGERGNGNAVGFKQDGDLQQRPGQAGTGSQRGLVLDQSVKMADVELDAKHKGYEGPRAGSTVGVGTSGVHPSSRSIEPLSAGSV